MTAEVYVDGSGVKDYTVSIAEAEPLEKFTKPVGSGFKQRDKEKFPSMLSEREK
ncbi:MAG: hypothetical protein L6V93_03500 [Clostridiales bacterium]|nr:MAG: hypothetical protein L6V93_03500 [Clostridiales bacterium]